MSSRRVLSLFSVSAASFFLFGFLPAGLVSAQDVRHECSEKYQAAKAADTLNGETWPQFYSQCAAEAKANAAAAQSTATTTPASDVRHICSERYQAAKAAGTLNGDTWPQFYSKCTAEVKANPPPATATAEPAPTPAPESAPALAVEPPPAPVAATPTPPTPPPAPVAQAPVAPPPAPANPLKTPAPAAPAPAAAAGAAGEAVYPTAIAPAYTKEKPARARQKTCADQYRANKATNSNGGLKWIQKGDGYWSECNKRLKGS